MRKGLKKKKKNWNERSVNGVIAACRTKEGRKMSQTRKKLLLQKCQTDVHHPAAVLVGFVNFCFLFSFLVQFDFYWPFSCVVILVCRFTISDFFFIHTILHRWTCAEHNIIRTNQKKSHAIHIFPARKNCFPLYKRIHLLMPWLRAYQYISFGLVWSVYSHALAIYTEKYFHAQQIYCSFGLISCERCCFSSMKMMRPLLRIPQLEGLK